MSSIDVKFKVTNHDSLLRLHLEKLIWTFLMT